ncbi:MAG: flippase-like domain-containing protein [Chloroflexota bacterium]|nr:MAG: flippase-like domain-containing protein [Chloroflexota bacterium]
MRVPPFAQKTINFTRAAINYLTTGWRRAALTVFMVLLSLAVIARVVIDNWDLLVRQEWTFAPVWLGYALLFFFIDLAISLFGWHLLVAQLTGFNSMRLNTKICLQSNLARRLPGSVWYVASRATLYQDVGVSKRKISMVSGLELVLFILSGILVTLITLPLWFSRLGTIGESIQIWWLLLVLPVALLLMHPGVLQRIWRRIGEDDPSVNVKWSYVATWIGIYVGTWLFGGAVLYCVIRVFHELHVSNLIVITGMWSLAGAISLIGFLVFSNIGLRELSLVLLLSLVIPFPTAIIVALVVRLIWLGGELLTSLLSFAL